MKIIDKLGKGLVVISLWKDETLQDLKVNSGVLAEKNEYQVHYWAVNFRKIYEDGSRLYIHIPTLFFNYKQEVSYASIEFDLNDVEEVSKALEPVQQLEVNKVYEEFKYLLDEGYEMENVSLNTLHRHP